MARKRLWNITGQTYMKLDNVTQLKVFRCPVCRNDTLQYYGQEGNEDIYTCEWNQCICTEVRVLHGCYFPL